MQSFTKEMEDIGNTIRMVEDSIKKFEGYPTETQLLHSLQGRINPTTLKNILVGLKRHNRIIYDKDDSIVWIAVDTPRAQQSLRESVLLR
jgi:hypothetical protein